MLLGRRYHIPSDIFSLPYNQRLTTEYSGYGGTSFTRVPGSLFRPGFVSSGGGGPGGSITLQPGGNAGNVTLNAGSATLYFLEPTQVVAGAGTAFGIPGYVQYSVMEVLNIRYANFWDTTFPSGGNGGRGRLSTGNTAGTNGGNGGNAGNISMTAGGGVYPNITASNRKQVVSLNDGGSGPTTGYVSRNVHLIDTAGGEFLRVSAIGGSGGPRGGSGGGVYGSNGAKGRDGSVDVFGIHLQDPDSASPAKIGVRSLRALGR